MDPNPVIIVGDFNVKVSHRVFFGVSLGKDRPLMLNQDQYLHDVPLVVHRPNVH